MIICGFPIPLAFNETVDGRNTKQPPGMYKTEKWWDKLPTSAGDRRISEPSTGSFFHFFYNAFGGFSP